jgi:anaerobic selenocysteine-containing dehydrogenase
MTNETELLDASAWHQTACILCECNCGVEVHRDEAQLHLDARSGD